MIHQPLGGAQGQATEIKIAAEHILKTKDKLNKILSSNTGKDLNIIEKDKNNSKMQLHLCCYFYQINREFFHPQY